MQTMLEDDRQHALNNPRHITIFDYIQERLEFEPP